MNITIITNEYSTGSGGGLSYSCHQLECLLQSMGHSVKVCRSNICETDVIHGGYNNHLGFDIVKESLLKRCVETIPEGNLLIGFGGGYNGYFTALLAQKSRCGYWLMFRGSDANLCKWNFENFHYNKYALEKCDKVFALSREIADNIKLVAPNKTNIVVIPNYTERISKQIKTPNKNNIHIGCGAFHLNEKKGISLLMRMVASYAQTYNQDITLECVGQIDDDVLEQYQNLADEMQISDMVSFTGRMEREDFKRVQGRWDYYIQGSICEGMGNSVIDSMSLGIPVLLTNTGYVAEMANKLYPEMIFSSYEPSKMAAQLYNMITDDDSLDKYESFYSAFFTSTTEEVIKHLWESQLNNDNHVAVTKPDGIISLSLHDVDGVSHDNITTPISVFESFVEQVHSRGYILCSMNDYMNRPAYKRKNCIVCTFDDGYVGLLDNALPIMNRYGFSATVFVCSDYMGDTNKWNFKDKKIRMHLDVDGLLELQQNGWEIGSHGVTHRSLLRLNDDEIVFELEESKRKLEIIFGPIKSYAYPYGDYSEYILGKVSEYYQYAFLLRQGGVYLPADSLSIHRYYISEINQIIQLS